MKLLIIEDSPRLRETLEKALSRFGHAVDLAVDGDEGLFLATSGDHDVIVLDRMLPGMEGLEVLQRLRNAGNRTPVLLLTALGDVGERVRGLGMGADDYLPKPFSLAELVARLEALHRRKYGQPDPVLRVGPLEIDTAAKTVTRDGVCIRLQAREFALLELLARQPGRVFSREQIESHLYSDEGAPQSNAVDAAVYALRRRISPQGTPPLIHTRRGLGYVFDP